MALLKENIVAGVNLPYKRFSHCQFDKGELIATFQCCASQGQEPLRSEVVVLSQEQSQALADKFTKLLYNELKTLGVISGMDC